MNSNLDAASAAFLRFIDIIKALRTPKTGCPWDLEQTHTSLRPYLIEEAYEVLEAIDLADDTLLVEELGDLLLQVVLHSQIAVDRNAFSIVEVIEGVAEKMIRRHPHVFSTVTVKDSAEVLKNWEELKQAEKSSSNGTPGFASELARIPKALPALIRAQRIGEKAEKAHFDWENRGQVWEKVAEEITELSEEIVPLLETKALDPNNKTRIEHELGDVLFSLTQLSRWLGISAEDALRTANERFLTRFSLMEQTLEKPLGDASLEEMDEAWETAKTRLKKQSSDPR